MGLFAMCTWIGPVCVRTLKDSAGKIFGVYLRHDNQFLYLRHHGQVGSLFARFSFQGHCLAACACPRSDRLCTSLPSLVAQPATTHPPFIVTLALLSGRYEEETASGLEVTFSKTGPMMHDSGSPEYTTYARTKAWQSQSLASVALAIAVVAHCVIDAPNRLCQRVGRMCIVFDATSF